jgi:hypothetical protein
MQDSNLLLKGKSKIEKHTIPVQCRSVPLQAAKLVFKIFGIRPN